MASVTDYNSLSIRQLFPGIDARIDHSENMTVMHVTLVEGADLPEHHHPQEQWTNVIRGSLEMTIDGETTILGPGMVAKILPDVPHSARAITDCMAIDVFTPPRTDLQ